MQVGELWVKIGGRSQAFYAAMAEIQQKGVAAANDIEGKLGSALSKVETAAKVAGAAAVAGFGAMVTSGVMANANMEQYRNTLNTVMGDSKRAAETLDWVKQYAAKTPYEIPELVESTVKLQAMGLEAKKMIPVAADMAAVFKSSGKTVGDAAEAINDAMMGEFERLKEFGIKLQATDFAAGGKYAGKTYAEAVMEEVKNHNYTGAADALGESFLGRLSTIKDTIGQTLQTITAPIFDKVAISLGNLLEKINQLQANGQLQQWTDQATQAMSKMWDITVKIGGVIVDIAKGIINNWEIIEPILAGAVASITAFKIISTINALMKAWRTSTIAATLAQGGLNAVLMANPIGLVIAGIGLLVAGGVALYKNWDTVKAKASQLWGTIKGAFDGIKGSILGVVQGALQWGQDIVQGLINGIRNKIAAVQKVAGDLANSIRNKIHKALEFGSPSKVMMQYGKWIDEGLAQGITDNTDTVMAALDTQTAATEAKLKEMQTRLQAIHDASAAQMAENDRKALQDDIANTDAKVKLAEQDLALKQQQLTALQQHGKDTSATLQSIAKAEQSLTEAKQAAVDARTKLDEFEAKAQVDATQKQIDSLKQQQKALQDYQDLLNDAKDVITQYYTDLKAARDDYDKKVADAQAQEIADEQQVTEAYENALNSRADALSNFVGLFDEVTTKDVSGEQLLNNLQGQVDAFENWQQNIQALAARGVDEGLIAELKEMGPKAGPEIAALNTLTDDQLTQYVSLWKQKNQDARAEAVSELTTQREEMEQKLIEIRISAQQQLEQYRQDWEAKNAEIRKNAMTELTTIENKFKEINEASTTYGTSLMSGFIAGIQSKRSELEETLQEIASLVDAYMPHSPAKKGALSRLNEWGPALVKNFADGIQKSIPTLENAVANMAAVSPAMLGPSISNVSSSSSTTYGPSTYHIYIQGANADEVLAKLKREIHRTGERW